MQQGPGRPRPRPFPRGSPGIFGAGNLARKFGDLACIPEEIFLGSPVKIPEEFPRGYQHFPNRLPFKTKKCNFFLFTTVFLWKFRSILTYFFLCPFSISRIMNAKKISKLDREVKSNGNTRVAHRFFFSLSLDFSYEHLERFPTICFYALLVFV